MSKVRRFPVSDQLIQWAQSLSGMLTTIKVQYGDISEMVEHPEWDESQTGYALSLLKSLRIHLSQLEEELTIHVEEKISQNPR